VRVWPTCTGSGVSVLAITRSAAGLTVVLAVAVLLSGFGSASVPLTLAVLVSVPAAVGWTTIVTVALAPLARFPRLHVTVLVPEQLPWPAEADTKVTPLGSVSLTVTPVAPEGPLLMAVSV